MPSISRTRSLQRRRRSGRSPASSPTACTGWRGSLPWHNRVLATGTAPGLAEALQPRLGGVPPIAAIDTELGARQVENVLGRIALRRN